MIEDCGLDVGAVAADTLWAPNRDTPAMAAIASDGRIQFFFIFINFVGYISRPYHYCGRVD
jgi:hypothetical protein